MVAGSESAALRGSRQREDVRVRQTSEERAEREDLCVGVHTTTYPPSAPEVAEPSPDGSTMSDVGERPTHPAGPPRRSRRHEE